MKLVKIPIDQAESRPYTIHAEIAEPNGRSFIRFVCPFCGERIKAYVWSLHGGGKRCPRCRAYFGAFGKGYRDLVPVDSKTISGTSAGKTTGENQ